MKKISILFLILASGPLMANDNVPVIKPIPLIALKKNSEQYAGVCHAVENRCTESAKVWKEKGVGEGYYLTNSTPAIIKIRKVKNNYIKDGEWSFSQCRGTDHSSDGELNREEISVFPALYPINKTEQAVALVSKWSTAYSGGGRVEEYADFLILNSNGSHQLAFKDIPFSSSEMIRACFSEEDYAKNSHCHDESWSILNLKIIDEGKSYYSWKFITRSYNWPSFTDKSSVTVETSEQVKTPLQKE